MKEEKQAKKLVDLAYKQLGKPYKYGAKPYEAPKQFDCSSFVQYLYSKIGIELPRTALKQASAGKVVKPVLNNLKPGDLIFIKGGWGHYDPEFPEGIGHVALYVGNGKVVNARGEAGKVIEQEAAEFLERKDFRVVKRILL